MANFIRPEDSPFPLMSYDEAVKLGLDVSKVCTCAIPDTDQVRGCRFAKDCAQRMFGRQENFGFGPRSLKKGAAGSGPKNVAYFHRETQTLEEREAFQPCYSFMVGLFDLYRQQAETGDIIEVLGIDGTKITTRTWLPNDPGSQNPASGMKEVIEVTVVPEFPKYIEQSPSMAYAMRRRENRIAMEHAVRRGRVDGDPEPVANEEQEQGNDGTAHAGPVSEEGVARRNRRGN